MTGPTSARMVLRDPSVDAAVLETARGGLLRRGLGFRKCNVSVCLNVAADHLGLKGIDTLEQLAEVKRTVIEVAQDTAVLNADDELCLKMADYTDAEVICYVTMDPRNTLVKEHIRSGGRAVVLEEGMNGHMITIYDKEQHIPLLWTHLIPATLDGRALHNVQNAMFAAATSYSMDLKLEDIRHGLRTFDTSFFQVPGRMNICDEHPFRVILDYGHNPQAVETMCQVTDRLDVTGRRLCVLAAPGDRRDEDIRDIARSASGSFDHYICRRDDSLRGRAPEEVPHMLQEALLDSGVAADRIDVVPDEQEAVNSALGMANEGDLVLMFGDAIARTWQQILTFDPQLAERAPESVTATRPATVQELPRTPLRDYPNLIRDERGVRLAREIED